jgi:2-hydroxy-3-oxopropionate reductase
MAMRLLNAGYALTAWNRTRAKANELAALNARVAQDIHRGFAESRILDLKPNAGQAAALLAIEKLNPGIRIRQAPAKLP